MSVEGLKEVKLPAGVTAKDILHTAPYNAYNPQQNQTKHCYAKYNEFFRQTFPVSCHCRCMLTDLQVRWRAWRRRQGVQEDQAPLYFVVPR
mmetsp:Transcript_4520/g.16518  ORF Transcript_4520/g.16518 Transcript_4520/m.16518 type:complete len:91 (-) Transcript_4520:170-442(-)